MPDAASVDYHDMNPTGKVTVEPLPPKTAAAGFCILDSAGPIIDREWRPREYYPGYDSHNHLTTRGTRLSVCSSAATKYPRGADQAAPYKRAVSVIDKILRGTK